MIFYNSLVDLGTVSVGKEYQAKFIYTEELNYITKFEVSCDCAKVYNDIKNKEVVALFTPKPIPTHLKSQGHYVKTLIIIVSGILKDQSNDGTETPFTESLSFRATIYK